MKKKLCHACKNRIRIGISQIEKLLPNAISENLLHYFDRYISFRTELFRKYGKTFDYPRVVHFELTNDCNLNCKMCERHYVWKNRDKGYMDFNLFKKGIDEIANWGPKIVQLNRFGESTLHPKIVEFTQYAKEKGIPMVTLITNGTLIDKGLARELIQAGLDKIAFSFEGAKKDTYESIRAGARYEDAKQNIENFIQIRDSKGSLPLIQLNSVYMEETKAEIKQVKQMWEDKVDFINIQNYIEKPGLPDLRADGKQKSPDRAICSSPAEKLIVFWNGDVVPCCLDSYGNLIVGNIRDSSLKEIWQGERLTSLREKLLNKKFEGLICDQCEKTWRYSTE